jgi:hypothetical protein
MHRFLTTGLAVVSSMIGVTIISSHVNASPGCYGVDPEGNNLDLSSLCSPSSEVNTLPSAPINSNINPEASQVTNTQETQEFSPTEEVEKDIQACFQSATCTQMVGGDNETEKTPHQVRIDQVLNGGRLNQN